MPSLRRETPLGPVTLVEEDGALVVLDWGGSGADETPVLIEAHRQLAAYFAGELTEFDLPLAPKVSVRQRAFLDALIAIPFGDTKTYGEIALETGMSAQGAGQACGANPIAIIIPCHRVTGTGTLGGFSAKGGVETKVALLRHEGAAGLLI
ncbi:methylated-DNA--[protein]-cysteine S-methyltransferase [uncultured Boseongicola sp.]|jgi:methylated-DNA-[protein]-cysteine S-methyltransferase|uniref:methylated-DNA--[protein]-cysteine S-methyltransferase n=1 Tax=uncultured Boseongicola sp. TaxID=1648499 RepID=UPI00261958B6|nr:methylated-DNA--[protein]-cysteine S-methyltransferase [uncultured Boseongicola sp.]